MITKYIEKKINFPFLLAYSGGLDSTFLLYQLLKIKKIKPQLKFRAIHINHQLHEHSHQWSEHCKKTCEKNNISLVIKTIIINTKKIGIEAAARLQRYKAIQKEMYPKEIILTAHNLNDQCETFLLALKRGSGITGLSGISYKHTFFKNNTIIRPLLNTTRSEIKSWIIKNNISWIKDPSNYNTIYDRNFLRHEILPVLTKRWPSFIKKCAQSAFILTQEKKILHSTLKKQLERYLISNSILCIENFKNLDLEMRNSLLRMWFKINNCTIPSYKIVQNIYYEIILSKPDSKAKITIKNYEIRRYRQNLYLIKILPCIKNLILIWHEPWNTLKLPHNLGYITKNKFGTILPCPKKNELINIRFQTSGNFLIQNNSKKKSISKIWKEHRIAPWNRNKIPLLFYNNHLISALGTFTISTKERNIRNETWNISWINKIEN
ncbi:MAG: tRNA lysidine(34) synthetase TilS [Buchnera aphidicola (Kaburagia rhusicola ensigallis)]